MLFTRNINFKMERCLSVVFLLCFYITTGQAQITNGYNIRGLNDMETNLLTKERSGKLTSDVNRKPMFNECENYKPSVEEERNSGTFVIQVHADDDDPKDSGGTVEYRIVMRDGELPNFNINNITGEIYTSQSFNRDEPNHQKELYLTVQATDNGQPRLSDICTFKVVVTDINDNSPTFDSQKYNAKVAEDRKVGSEVMRVFAYDIDDGENSKLTYTFENNTDFNKYFMIDNQTGVVYLHSALTSKQNYQFSNVITVSDNGQDPKSSTTTIFITVVSSDKKIPTITKIDPEGTLRLKENFNDYSKNLVTIIADSAMDDKAISFELIKGKTIQTNRDQTFVLYPTNDNTAEIRLVRPLDYETVTEYVLTVFVRNKDLMENVVTIHIEVEDVNDETPNFLEFLRGSVVENDQAGAQAIQVRAIDKDGTSANNIVSYELVDNTDNFSINSTTGVIVSKVEFDREQVPLYHVTVKAYDNSPSALIQNSNQPNTVLQTFQISIEDQNDNKPRFTQPTYQFSNISESADKLSPVGEVKALDRDTASLITYSIIEGNEGEAFVMEATTGRVKVNSKLDFEKIEKYELTVRAFDGIFEDTAKVIISILNVNDEVPIFIDDGSKIIPLNEEEEVKGCITTIKAYDPDIKDKNADQHIVYEVEPKDFLTVDTDGCVRLTKTLDRDPPHGNPTRQVFIYALDNDGGTNSLRNGTEKTIELNDINDNPPFLNVTEIVWYENQPPALIGTLSADDYDGPDNGPPFVFRLADTASEDILNKFSVNSNQLQALVYFNREEQKYYDIPISITDSGQPSLIGTSNLRVIIGDINDNQAKDGESEIFVYKYKFSKDIEIGRVFVDDLDDWDINDKTFVQQNFQQEFSLDPNNRGMILMSAATEAGTYVINYEVTEENEPSIPRHKVRAIVTVQVKEIPEEAVRKSGSIRMKGASAEDFVAENGNTASKKNAFHNQIAKIVNTSLENVDVFTVMHPSNKEESFVDIRFSAHGSPYYYPEKLNNKVTEHQDSLQNLLGVEFVMININECLNETACPAYCSCTNVLNIQDEPAVVFTNRTSFVGVNASVSPVCDMIPKEVVECFNGGTPLSNGLCSCLAGSEGPNCEILGIGFIGDGWAMYPTFEAWNKSTIILHVLPQSENGLIFYAGPLTLRHAQYSKDFISLELEDGYPVLRLNYGEGTKEIHVQGLAHKLNNGALHKLKIAYSAEDVQIEVDDCGSRCIKWEAMPKGLLNINGPLQLGGTRYKFNPEESKIIWNHAPPTSVRFNGCIRNLTYNDFYYNLGAPSDQYNAYPDCNYGVMQAVTFGIDSNFLVAILVCVAILIILLLAVVVHRRKQDNLHKEDIDDTRENIINYEDEGGGECDTNYDLSVFRHNHIQDEKPALQSDVPADISGFLDNKKDNCDKDPENLPFDDVRHYAYEGDGNSTGSLSSLASCTDEGDLKFNYLSSFGPRFRKLADMYGEDPSDEDSHDGGEESWC